MLWRSIYEANGRFHVDAVRVGVLADVHVFAGASVSRFTLDELERVAPKETRQRDDLQRFARFSDGYLARIPGSPGVIGDIRYASLPNGLEPIWGVVLAEQQDAPLQLRYFRDIPPETRDRFLGMLFP